MGHILEEGTPDQELHDAKPQAGPSSFGTEASCFV